MWTELPIKDREEYKKMILAFASLTEMFAQKSEENIETSAPIINSKYQETIFQKAFNASGEDIGNTAYDVSISKKMGERLKRYLVGIKTFGIAAGDQKVAQFKANLGDWSGIITNIQNNSKNDDGSAKKKDEIDKDNLELYKTLALEISKKRNERIKSAMANLQGFEIADEDVVESVYHVLMPSKKGHNPEIYVGETSYDQIDIENIKIHGCTSANNPTNFSFSDGKHDYKYTSADSQLYMKFNNENIILETWPVKYADDAYGLFAEIADKIYGIGKDKDEVIESYSWKIANKQNEVEQYSGFNAFNGVGSKLSKKDEMREKRIEKFVSTYQDCIDEKILAYAKKALEDFLLVEARNESDRKKKADVRNEALEIVIGTQNEEFINEFKSLVCRPENEMYIPLPRAKVFHNAHPDFFGKNIGTFEENGKKLKLPKNEREFNLIFEPSGDMVRAFIAEECGKAIESVDKQTILGEWILKKIFQLQPRETLTEKKLRELGINGIRIYKLKNSPDIHLEFIWIGDEKPSDFIEK